MFFCFRLQRRSLEMKKVMATLRAIVEVMKSLSKDADPDGVGRLIIEEVQPFACLPWIRPSRSCSAYYTIQDLFVSPL
jgi:hypothetical protein